jgi:hypothetical protein
MKIKIKCTKCGLKAVLDEKDTYQFTDPGRSDTDEDLFCPQPNCRGVLERYELKQCDFCGRFVTKLYNITTGWVKDVCSICFTSPVVVEWITKTQYDPPKSLIHYVEGRVLKHVSSVANIILDKLEYVDLEAGKEK